MVRAHELRFPCRSGRCVAGGLTIIAMWVALLAGFLAEITAAAPPEAGPGSQAAAVMATLLRQWLNA